MHEYLWGIKTFMIGYVILAIVGIVVVILGFLSIKPLRQNSAKTLSEDEEVEIEAHNKLLASEM